MVSGIPDPCCTSSSDEKNESMLNTLSYIQIQQQPMSQGKAEELVKDVQVNVESKHLAVRLCLSV